MTTISPHTTRAPGTILTATIYNTDHVNHILNATNLNSDKLEGATPPVVDSHIVLFNGTSGAAIKTSGTTVAAILAASQPLDELLTEIAALSTDPGADRGLFFDDSANAMAYWAPVAPLSFSTTNLQISAASDSAVGVIELATQAEMETGTDVTRAVVPGRQQHHRAHPKAWGKATWAAGVASLTVGQGVSSVTDGTAGRCTFTFSTAFSDTNFIIADSVDSDTAGTPSTTENKTTTSVIMFTYHSATGAATDPFAVDIVAWGDQ